VIFRDLMVLEENPNWYESGGVKLINFVKRRIAARQISTVLKYQVRLVAVLLARLTYSRSLTHSQFSRWRTTSVRCPSWPTIYCKCEAFRTTSTKPCASRA